MRNEIFAFSVSMPLSVDYAAAIGKATAVAAKKRGRKLFIRQPSDRLEFYEVPWNFKKNEERVQP